MPHYQPCLLVFCLTIGHAFWCSASLSAMPSGMVPHYRPSQLVWCLIISNVCWCGSEPTGMVYSEEPHQQTITFESGVQLYQQCTLGTFIQIRVFVKCCSGIWSVRNPSDMPTGRELLPLVCKTCRLPYWTPS